MPKNLLCLLRRSHRFSSFLALAEQHIAVDLERFLSMNIDKWPDVGAHIAHPIMTAAFCAQVDSLRYDGRLPDVVAGFGLGEFCAIYAADVIEAGVLIELACLRGELLSRVTGKSLLLVSKQKRLSIEEVLESVAEGLVFESVRLSRNRMIVAVDQSGLESLATRLPDHVEVSLIRGCGPWYCPMVGSAALSLSEALQNKHFADPTCDVIMSPTARIERKATEIRATLQRQLTSPALWGDCITHLVAEGHRHFLDFSVCHGSKSTLKTNLPRFLNCSVFGPSAFKHTVLSEEN